MKKIGVIVILAVLVFVTGCSNQPSVTEETQPSNEVFWTPIVTPTPSPTPAPTPPPFYSFDADYQNLSSENYEIIALGNQVFYTTGDNLYVVNLETQEKKLIAEDLIYSQINYYNDYVYYLKEDTFERVNVETYQRKTMDRAESFVTTYGGTNGVARKGSAGFISFSLNENYLMLYGDLLVDYYGDGYAGTDVERRTLFQYITDSGLKSAEDASDEDVAIFDIENGAYQIVIDFIGSIYDIVQTGDYLFYLKDDTRTSKITGEDINTDEKVFSVELQTPYSEIFAANQYVIVTSCIKNFLPYDEVILEVETEPLDVIILDTKTCKEYRSEEIDEIISGSVNYQDLCFSNFYFADGVLYMMENNFNQITIDFGGGLVGTWGENEKAGLIDSDTRGPRIMDIPSDVNIYKAEVIDGKLHFTLLYQEFETEE